MAHRRPIGRKLIRSLLPIILVPALALMIAVGAIVYSISRPPRHAYLVTPQTFTQSGPVLKTTEENWRNRDGTQARGWLLRGAEGAPAVVLFHRYGADRSWLFNLAVKLHETTGFTILCVDLRGHGVNPPVKWTSFGAVESDDVLAAFDFLKALKAPRGSPLIGERRGAYGVELGAYAALRAAAQEPSLKVLVLDSVPTQPDDLLQAVARDYLGTSWPVLEKINNRTLLPLTRIGMRVYFPRHYDNKPSCGIAASLQGRKVFLLSGAEAGYLRNSTINLTRCFQPADLETATDLPLTGFNLPITTGEQEEAYDRRVIEFFDKTLRAER